jgi:ATP-dependent RNA helicase DeaD
MDIAAAAIKQGAAEPEANEPDIPAPNQFKEKHPARARGDERALRRDEKSKDTFVPAKGRPRLPKPGWEAAKLYVGAGRKLKIRPGDLVGAITNEMGLDSTMIGAITIFDRHSIVEVPASLADTIVAGLNATTIKGKKLQVRRDRAG